MIPSAWATLYAIDFIHINKQELTPMKLLAVIGKNGIGRLGFTLRGQGPTKQAEPLSKSDLKKMPFSDRLVNELIDAYLATGIGISGMQPKIMLPDKLSVPVPSLIVKMANEAYPGLTANEYLCLTAAQTAGIQTPTFDLSDDGQLLLVDRFDLEEISPAHYRRLGFEDMAALAGLRVRDVLSDRKYHGSYENIAHLMVSVGCTAPDLYRFFEQVAFSVMVRNGDAHLKNFGLLYHTDDALRLSPLYDVVTTSLYSYNQFPGGAPLPDRTLALKLFSGKHQNKLYPSKEQLTQFGQRICLVSNPSRTLNRIADAMSDTLKRAQQDERIPTELLVSIEKEWTIGMSVYA